MKDRPIKYMMKAALVLTITSTLLLAGCSSTRYPNWQHVRIEPTVPSAGCQYKIQEACGLANAECYNWYKKRATRHGANTVVITRSDQALESQGRALVFNGTGGGSSNTTTNMIALADYYSCPSNDGASATDRQ